MIRAYPRLPYTVASELLIELNAVASEGVAALRRRASTEHRLQIHYETAGRQTPEHLTEVARVVREVAAQAGYPEPLQGRGDTTRARSFDRSASVALLSVLDIAPVDAGEDGVWSFLSLVLLPDVAFWRWPNITEKSDYERLLGRPRNVLRRLWWRAYCLGGEASSVFLEDEAVAIMERPAIGGDPRVARAVAGRHLRAVDENPGLPRTEILREAAKRFRRLTTVLTLPTLTDFELDALVDEVFSDVTSILNLQRQAAQSGRR